MDSPTYEYHGLMAASWDLLRGDTRGWPDRAFYREVIEDSGQPVLDVGCGTGRLLLDFLAQGIDVDGVDNSPEMLALLRQKAAAQGLSPAVYQGSMEDLELPRRYRTILVPSSSFQLLTDPQAARRALQRLYEHLKPGGTLALPFFTIPRKPGMQGDLVAEDWQLMGEKVRPEDGLTLRYWGRSTYDFINQLEHTESRYELLRDGEVMEEEHHTRSPADRWYTQAQARELLEEAGFVGLRAFHEFTRQPAAPEDTLFSLLAERPLEWASAYVSSIPAEAVARPGGPDSQGAPEWMDYLVGDELVGRRWFDADEELTFEIPFQNGLQHGRVYRWDTPGRLLSVETYKEGRSHGVAYQWDDAGRLLGTYTMDHGSGMDLWFSACGPGDDKPALSEVRFARDGALDGFEWWLRADQRGPWHELHWRKGRLHGIERQWNSSGRLKRGYPRYWLDGERVDRRRYLTAARSDPGLPPFRPEDNHPEREFPAEVRRYMKRET